MPKMIWKCDIRWQNCPGHRDGDLTDRTLTSNRDVAEAAYRALLARADLIGQSCAARLVTPHARGAVYFSRFDCDVGHGRIHPAAPLDLDRTDDGTPEASAWTPSPPLGTPQVDWVTDPRPFSEVLADWITAHNGGQRYGARGPAAEALGIPPDTLASWLDGRRSPQHERAMRLAMIALDEKNSSE